MTQPDTTPDDLDRIAARADEAAPALAASTPTLRAAGLLAVADALTAAAGGLVPVAMAETGLAEGRLRGELTRTCVQLRLFADVVRDGTYLDARLDEADPGFALGTRPDLRRLLVPVGPVLNFAASNFPFAFSVAGGDTAAALAAGCPVVVKAHPGHPALSAATARIVSTALAGAGWPAGAFGVVFGQDAGVALLRDPRIRAAAFTGSLRAGRVLADIAAGRPDPIPFYGELGSVNPVFVTPAGLAAEAAVLPAQYVASVSGSAGQLCTKPGFLFLPEGHGLDAAIAAAAADVPEHRLLHPGIAAGYRARRDAILATPEVGAVHAGTLRIDADGQGRATPTVVATTTEGLVAHRDRLLDEAFGPLSVVVTYRDADELPTLAADLFPGNLTGTLHVGPADDCPALPALTAQLARSCGRVLFGGWPTGVAVTPAMQHGGPWPATTDDRSTSVGTAAISRFLRGVAFQDAPDALLPGPLRDANPWGVPRRVARAGASRRWGSAGA